MVHGVVVPANQLGDGHQLIALLLQPCDYSLQGLGSVFGSIVHENDGAVAQMLVAGDGLDNRIYAVVLPVQRVYTRQKKKCIFYAIFAECSDGVGYFDAAVLTEGNFLYQDGAEVFDSIKITSV